VTSRSKFAKFDIRLPLGAPIVSEALTGINIHMESLNVFRCNEKLDFDLYDSALPASRIQIGNLDYGSKNTPELIKGWDPSDSYSSSFVLEPPDLACNLLEDVGSRSISNGRPD
jgi:hypothetical protein